MTMLAIKKLQKNLPKPIDLNFTKSNKKCPGYKASAELAGWILLVPLSNLQFYIE